MELIKGDGGDEPLDRWTVTRTWRGVEASSYHEAILASRNLDHDQVRVEREDTSPQLFDTEIVSTTVCRFSGRPMDPEADCSARLEAQHPDVECARTLVALDVVVDLIRPSLGVYPDLANVEPVLRNLEPELRAPYAWGAHPLTERVAQVQVTHDEMLATLLEAQPGCRACNDRPALGTYCADCGRQG